MEKTPNTESWWLPTGHPPILLDEDARTLLDELIVYFNAPEVQSAHYERRIDVFLIRLRSKALSVWGVPEKKWSEEIGVKTATGFFLWLATDVGREFFARAERVVTSDEASRTAKETQLSKIFGAFQELKEHKVSFSIWGTEEPDIFQSCAVNVALYLLLEQDLLTLLKKALSKPHTSLDKNREQ